MTKESLMKMGLTEQQAEDVMKALDGSYVTKSRFDEVNTAKNKLEEDLKDRDKQLTTLKESAGDNEEMKTQISTLQQENKAAKEKYEKDMKELSLTSAIKIAIADKAQDVDLVAGLFDKEKLSLVDGKVNGLEEQLKHLQETKSFLFKTGNQQQNYNPTGGKGGNTANPFAKETWNMTEQGKIFRENPAQARELAAAAGVEI